jgi:hypothetical protein
MEKKTNTAGLKKLIRAVESDDEDDVPEVVTSTANFDPSKPWLPDFRQYIDTLEATLPVGMSTIQWWGVSRIMSPCTQADPVVDDVSRSMHNGMVLCGPQLHETFCPSWLRPCRARERSRKVASLLVNDVVGSKEI